MAVYVIKKLYIASYITQLWIIFKCLCTPEVANSSFTSHIPIVNVFSIRDINKWNDLLDDVINSNSEFSKTLKIVLVTLHSQRYYFFYLVSSFCIYLNILIEFIGFVPLTCILIINIQLCDWPWASENGPSGPYSSNLLHNN